jgi:hypothetical protein
MSIRHAGVGSVRRDGWKRAHGRSGVAQ